MNTENTAIVDSLDIVVRDRTGKVKAARFIKNGREFVANDRYLAALNKGRQPWKIPVMYGRWQRLLEI